MKVISLAVDSKPEEHHSCISHRYALSSLQALTNTKLPHLAKTLQLLSNNCRVAIQWILTHCKGRCYCELPTKATITKAIMMPSQEKDAYHLLSISEQVIMISLRTEHNRLNAHMHKQLKRVLWAACPCGEGDQTKEHILQNCKRHDQKRYAAWTTEKTPNQKLHGDERTSDRQHSTSLRLAWLCNSEREEEKEDKEVMYLVHL